MSQTRTLTLTLTRLRGLLPTDPLTPPFFSPSQVPPGVILPPEAEDAAAGADESDKDPDADLLMPEDPEDEAVAAGHYDEDGEEDEDDGAVRVCGHKV